MFSRDERWRVGSWGVPVVGLVLWVAAGPVSGAELLVNGTFDTDLSGWTVLSDLEQTAHWSSVDAAGSTSSGSVEVVNRHPGGGFLEFPMAQCVPVDDGKGYRASAKIRIGFGQPTQGDARLILGWYPNTACMGDFLASDVVGQVSALGSWLPVSAQVVAPNDAESVMVWLAALKVEVGGSFRAYFDDVSVEPVDEGGGSDGECEVLPGPYLTDPDFPGFRFKVEITSAAGVLAAAFEPACLPETLCVSGALPGRTEVQVRLIGPRPNGYLWIQVVRFTPSKIRVLAEQVVSGACRLYTLEAIPRTSDDLDGFVHRTAFLP